MKNTHFLSEIFLSEWAIEPQIAQSYIPSLIRLKEGKSFYDEIIDKDSIFQIYKDKMFVDCEINEAPENTVGIINITGELMKFGNICFSGTEEIAKVIKEANRNENIISLILKIHSHGGSTMSTIPLSDAIKNFNKPIIVLIDSVAYCAAYYIASFANKIIAIDKMSELGSIGVTATLIDDREKHSKQGIKINLIYPPESKWKHKPYNEALKGNNQLMITEKLSPYAKHFQDTIKENRKNKLKLSVPGLLQGRNFYAYDAVKNGLIDEIGNFEYAFDIAQKEGLKKLVNSYF